MRIRIASETATGDAPTSSPRGARRAAVLFGALVALVAAAQHPTTALAFGEPLTGLLPAHLGWFDEGRQAFTEVYTSTTGLGPIFNAASCDACHNIPVAGGGSARTVTHFGRTVDGVFDPLRERGGPLLQTHAIDPACQEVIPPEANTIAERLTTPTFGAGLIEAVEDATILEYADPDDANGDGISGRVQLVQYPGRLRIGRFGWKSQEATLLSFAAEAFASEMSVTTSLIPDELAPNGDRELGQTCAVLEAVADPDDETSSEEFANVVKVTNFTRLLAPPTVQRRPRGRGWRYFRSIGCATCHRAELETGPHTIPALDHAVFYPYSDFLLHDMGALGDGIAEGQAEPTEMRTAPLWGIGSRTRFLHDGRAETLFDAVAAHDGEAAAASDKFVASRPRRQTALLDFIAGL